jgi:predicted ATPase
MKIIKSITISGLFGTFNHNIEFSQGNDVTILLGQNGIGKTAILRLINMFFNHQLSKLTEIPFKNAVISFVDGDEINIDLLNGSIDNVIDYDIKYNDSFMEAVSCSQIADRVRDALRNIRGYISENYKNDEDVWIDRKTGEWMSGEELVWQCYEKHQDWLINVKDIYPIWLFNIIDDVKVSFIQTQRLQLQVASVIPGRVISKNILEYQSTLNIIAEEMKQRLVWIQQEYGQKAAELDQTYPYRLVDNMKDLQFTKAELYSIEDSLNELEKRRERLMGAGLLKKTEWQSRKLNTNTRSPYVLKAIQLYIDDTEQKFSLFDDELKKIELFRKIINDRLLWKEVKINVEKGIEVESTETDLPIPLEKLSSGEQHLLVLYYDMIFRIDAGTLVLIDEPEISLHVSWQKRFIPEVKKISEVNGMKALIATHSPTLIGKYWYLTKELDKDLKRNEPEE